jgi:soluble lytic murein transglycosylase-like protein
MSVEDDANAAEARISQLFAQIGGDPPAPQNQPNPAADGFNALVQEHLNNNVTDGVTPQGVATPPPTDLDAMIERAAAANNVDPNLIRAVAKNESGFNANAVSPVGAKGEMQLMDGTAAGLGVSNSFDPQQNFNGGAKYLHGLLNEFHGDMRKAIAAYNAGPGAVEKYGGVPPYAETQVYVNNVLASYEAYQAKTAYSNSAKSKAAGGVSTNS